MKWTILFTVAVLSVSTGFGQPVLHPWQTINTGGGTSGSAGTTLLSAVGQPAVGTSDSGGARLGSGFVSGATVLTGAVAHFSTLSEANWNMISVPLLVSDFRTTTLYPSAISSAFIYSSSMYSTRDTLQNGRGYWVKFAGADTIQFSGTALAEDTIDVEDKWNMVGTIGYPILVSDAIPIPPVTIEGSFFRFSVATGYVPVDTLMPGSAYWVRVSNDGRIALGSGSLLAVSTNPPIVSLLHGEKKSPTTTRELKTIMSTLTVSDAKGSTRELFFSSRSKAIELKRFELPPSPPSGVLDIRYASQRLAEIADDKEVSRQEFPIVISSATYPITINWKSMPDDQDATLEIAYANGPPASHRLDGDGSITVRSEGFLGASVRLQGREAVSLPKELALSQNYPNPFNPTTTIKYDLPSPAYVTVKVHDLLGREIATLVNEQQTAGYKSVEWNALNMATGVYFYHLQVGDFSQVRKMLFMK